MFKSLLLKGRTVCLLLCCMVASLVVTAQTKHTGKVIGSDDKLPVVGASVRIKGTNTGAVTDVNGEFSLTLAPGNVLEVSYIGYTTLDVTVKDGSFLTISLNPASNSLNEVVVTGYATQLKKDITGAVATVDVTDAKKIPATSSEQLLQGQASGVTVINEGAPGSPSTVYIRGITNFGNTTPLYVIDGVQQGNMSTVNPNDIESISVLKDAGSAAIYGVSGGNGVIVVTTKKGKPGKTVFSYDAYYGSQQPLSGNVWHLMTPTQQMDLARENFNGGDSSLYDPTKAVGSWSLPTYGYHGTTAYSTFGTAGVTNDPSIVKGYIFDPVNPNNDFLVQKFNQAGTDWFHELFHSAPEQSHTVTASGGSDKSTFLYSVSYLNQTGTLLYNFEKRYQARVNNTYSMLNNHFRFGESGYAYYRSNNGGSPYNQQQEAGTVSDTYREMPLIPAYDVAGHFGGTYDSPGGEPLGNGASPLAAAANGANANSNYWGIQGTVFAEADFLKYFTVRTAFGGNAVNNFYWYESTNPYQDYESHANPNSYTEVSNYFYQYNYTNSIKYNETFGKSNVTVFAGFETKTSGGQSLGAAANSFVTLDPNFVTVAANTAPTSVNLSNNTYLYQTTGTESVFGRLEYAYDDKYLLGLTVRRDGYSSFQPGRQWGTFPSASIGWRVSQESFLKGVKWINDLKLRASYGETGSNANIGGTNTVNTYNYGYGSSDYGIAGGLNTVSTGYAQTSIGNPKTTWETDKITNLGIDASLFNHLDLNLEWYKKAISGLLFPVTLPATAGGANPPTVNVGDVQNTGVDLSATYHDAIGKDFRFSVGVNLTSYKNKITALGGAQSFTLFGGSRIGAFVQEKVGDPIGEFYGYKIVGLIQSGTGAGTYQYADINGDGKIDANDRTEIGNPNPDFTYGANINASYKGFDISAVFYGSQGNKDFNYVKYWTDTYNSFPGGKDVDLLNSAVVTNGAISNGGTLQALSASTPPSTFYVENGSFLKLRVLQLGYTFDPGLLKSIGVTKLHVYLQGTNLFTITKYTGLDPELVPSINNASGSQQSASSGVDWGAYPNNQKAYLIGVNLTF